jgi:ankyrin repeat protein
MSEDGQLLMNACMNSDFPRVRSLASSGKASVNFRNGDGDTPALVCCSRDTTDSSDILTYLIQRGANLNLANRHGHTALHHAATNNKPLSMAVLLQNGANAEVTTNFGFTALMVAAWNNGSDCTTLLLRHGVTLDTVDIDGRTALWYASANGYLSIVELLVEGGSDIEIADNDGKKARDIARDLIRTAIVEYLRTPLKDKRWLRRSGLVMVRSSIRDVEDDAAIIRALQCDDVARVIGSFL